jgi:hypothetical protein
MSSLYFLAFIQIQQTENDFPPTKVEELVRNIFQRR